MRIVKRHQEHREDPAIGRPRILDKFDTRYISRLATSGKCCTATEISNELLNYSGILASPRTVIRALNQNNIISRYKKKKPQLSKTHRRGRREFEKSHRGWTEKDWDRVVWSDETKICLQGSDGRERNFVRKGERLQDHNFLPTKKFGGGSIMVWGCMFSCGVGFLCRVDGGINAEMYLEILKNELLDSINWYGFEKDNIIFQQDNASCHKAKVVADWFQSTDLEVMKWPAQSPDLNPIEYLWDHLKRKIREGPKSNSLDELWKRVETEWNRIPQDVCENLVRSMPRRLKELRDAKGGNTKY